MSDGARLAARLWLPDVRPAPVVLEALPYRMDDLTASYASEYERLCEEGGLAVARVDLRGTGSSDGIATDEYPPQEQVDLRDVDRVARGPGVVDRARRHVRHVVLRLQQPAARGRAAVPGLEAIVAIYATDDRYTDDVHYTGGALQGDRPRRLRPLHGRDERAAPGSLGRGRRLARRRGRADRGCRAVAPAVARGAAGRAVLAPRLACASARAARELRADRLPHDARRRLGGRLPQQLVPHVRAPALPQAAARRPVEPHVDRHVAAGAAPRPRAGADPLVLALAA